MKKLKVLIADDIDVITEGNKKIVEKNSNIEVIGIANDGNEEYELILKLKPDIVVTDNQMPKMNGIEVIEKILNSNSEYKPKFILVTSDTGWDLYERCSKLEGVVIVNKFSREEMLPYVINDCVVELLSDE